MNFSQNGEEDVPVFVNFVGLHHHRIRSDVFSRHQAGHCGEVEGFGGFRCRGVDDNGELVFVGQGWFHLVDCGENGVILQILEVRDFFVCPARGEKGKKD